VVENDLPAGEKMRALRVVESIADADLFAAKPLIIGHRGASKFAPENTIAAFEKAVAEGADGIEFDVRLSKDGVPVVFHDANLKRTGLKDHAVAALTARELSHIDAGSWFNRSYPKRADEGFARATVPTLAETLDLFRNFGGVAYVELKCVIGVVVRTLRAVSDVVRSSPIRDRLIVKSFALAAIPLIRSMAPGVRTAALFAPKVMTLLRKEKHLVKIAAELGADELSIHYSLATKKLMQRAERRGLPVTIWTADNPRWVKRSIRLGIKAIITNDPARLLERRTELQSES
jgi:glycerophosphoryl diester phosphodiesterase